MRHFIHFTDSTLFEVIHSFLINDLIVTIPTARGSQRAIEMSCSDLLLANPLRKHNVSKEILVCRGNNSKLFFGRLSFYRLKPF